MSRPPQDATGLFDIRVHAHVKVTHPRHRYYRKRGAVVRIEGRRIWIAFPGGVVAPANHRSVEVIPR